MSHVTPEAVPVALAIAERDGANGRDLLVALAAGFETTTRVGIGLDYPAFRAKGWHAPGVIGPFGAAAAAGRLRGFDAETMARALGLAGSQAAGTFAAWGTPTVKFHQCRGALGGLMAALLAEQKFLATREFLTHKDGGLYNTYSNGGRPEAATADLGKRWELNEIALRLWPSASQIQGMNTALFDLVEQQPHRPGAGEEGAHRREPVGVRPARRLSDLQGQVRSDAVGALHGGRDRARSGAHAHAVCRRALRRSEAAARRGRASRGEARSHARRRLGTAEIEMIDGTKLNTRCVHPRGAPENPLSRAQIEAKFQIYAPIRLGEPEIEQVIAAVDRLEDFGSVRGMIGICRRSAATDRSRPV